MRSVAFLKPMKAQSFSSRPNDIMKNTHPSTLPSKHTWFTRLVHAGFASTIVIQLLIFRRHQFLSHLRSPTGLYDEPKILPYAKTSICPRVADVRQRIRTNLID